MGRFLPGLIFLLLGGLLLMTQWPPLTPPEAEGMIGEHAPPLHIALLPGSGSRPTQGPYLLNFFASWCMPCQAEHAELVKLKAIGVPIVGVLWHDDPRKAAVWLAQHGSPYATVGHDTKGETAIAYRSSGVPETLVIDGEGRIAYRWRGPLTPALVEREILPRMPLPRMAQ